MKQWGGCKTNAFPPAPVSYPNISRGEKRFALRSGCATYVKSPNCPFLSKEKVVLNAQEEDGDGAAFAESSQGRSVGHKDVEQNKEDTRVQGHGGTTPGPSSCGVWQRKALLLSIEFSWFEYFIIFFRQRPLSSRGRDKFGDAERLSPAAGRGLEPLRSPLQPEPPSACILSLFKHLLYPHPRTSCISAINSRKALKSQPPV